MERELRKSSEDKKLLGVCGGIGEFFDIDSTFVRIALILFVFLGGSGILLYLIAALVMKQSY